MSRLTSVDLSNILLPFYVASDLSAQVCVFSVKLAVALHSALIEIYCMKTENRCGVKLLFR